jgi:DNA primase
VIPDQILRSTYLSELSQRMDIKEQTLLKSMNGMIRKDIEEKEKERERNQGDRSLDSGQSPDQGPVPLIPATPDYRLQTPSSEVETLLVQSIIRDGERVIFEHVEMDDGSFTDLTVAQYVNFDLGQDDIHFHNDLYNQILEEAVAHSGEPDFKAETYFMHHPDVNISSLATRLAIDTHQLGKSFQVKEREGGLRQHVLHLVLDLRMDIVENRLKELKAEMRQVGSDMARIKALMEEFKETQELRNALAQQLGNDLVG